jgi:hypothetical protein
MVCPKCGYALSDLEAACPQCAAEGSSADATPMADGAAWEEWRRQTVAYLMARSRASEESAARALATCSWDAQAALAVLHGGAPIPLPPGSAVPDKRTSGSTVPVIAVCALAAVVVLVGPVASAVGLAVRNAGQRAKSARKASEVRAINECCRRYANDTGLLATRVSDVTQDPASAPSGYNGPYLIGNLTDPFTGAEYAVSGGTVVGPGDVTTFLR